MERTLTIPTIRAVCTNCKTPLLVTCNVIVHPHVCNCESYQEVTLLSKITNTTGCPNCESDEIWSVEEKHCGCWEKFVCEMI